MVHLSIAELEWAVHVKGGAEMADKLAQRHGMKNLGEIIPQTNYYLLRTINIHRSKRSISDLDDIFSMDDDVDWAEYQTPKIRVKRGPLLEDDNFPSEPNERSFESTDE